MHKLKDKSKPGIVLGLRKSTFAKNNFLTKFINTKDPVLKKELHIKDNNRNLLSTLKKENKQV